MIRFEHTEVVGWEHAIRGMRNPMNSWEKSDSRYGCDAFFGGTQFCDDGCHCYYDCHTSEAKLIIGPDDLALMKKLVKAGSDHRKFMRMIAVYVDITAPLYWWKEFDTYKVGTVANSCSTMHKIHAKEFTIDDFSHEHLEMLSCDIMEQHVIKTLNIYRELFLQTNDKKYWWNMIQLLPSSYNQRRTMLLNYEVLRNMYHARKAHKLDEWREGFCKWVEVLPYAELITGGESHVGTQQTNTETEGA